MTQDYHFSFQFKKACGKEIKEHCHDKKSKPEVVHCLVALVVDDSVLDQDQRVNQQCRSDLENSAKAISENPQIKRTEK